MGSIKQATDKPQKRATAASSTAPERSFDPALVSLFAQSSGPVYRPTPPPGGTRSVSVSTSSAGASDEEKSSKSELDAIEDLQSEQSWQSSASEEQEYSPRKRRRLDDDDDDLENAYLNRLLREEAKESQKFRNQDNQKDLIQETGSDDDSGDQHSPPANTITPIAPYPDVPVHETLTHEQEQDPETKSRRTIFLGNVSTDAIRSKSARRTLLNHLSSALQDLSDHGPAHKILSLRFRSTPFAAGVGPKKAAFAKMELMDSTAKSTNAYVVYSNEIAAQNSATKLNGTIVLSRHLRADYLGNPTKIDHRRCVFVGNLNFVDEELVDNSNAENDQEKRRPKGKEPADLEEGLWRAFAQAGKIENVRVVRDKQTRVGKGFAYVQFFNENAVEAALLLNDKKFPPMLPRKLRVTRAKKLRQRNKDEGTRSEGFHKTQSRAGSLPRSHQTALRNQTAFIFEGHRASSKAEGKARKAKPEKSHARKPNNRSTRRAAAFRAAGGKRETTSQ